MAYTARSLFLTAILLAAAILPVPNVAFGADESQRWRGKVKLEIGGDAAASPQVTSYIGRELRALNDIDIVEANPDWIIRIVVGDLAGGDSNADVRGYVMAVAIFQPFSNQVLSEMLTPKSREVGLKLTRNLTLRPHVLLNWGGNVQEICRRLVLNFDSMHFEEARKWHREFLEEVAKEKQAAKQKQQKLK